MITFLCLFLCFSCVIVLIYLAGSLNESLERFDAALIDFEMILVSKGFDLGGFDDETN